jgi:hypothetical protein
MAGYEKGITQYRKKQQKTNLQGYQRLLQIERCFHKAAQFSRPENQSGILPGIL